MNSSLDKYKGSLLFSAIGDSLGWVTEFTYNENDLFKKYGLNSISDFMTWEKKVGGRFYGYIDKVESGSYSDDTQLMLSVARSFGKSKNLDQDYFAEIELANWLSYSRGAGRTIKNAARKIQRKSARWNDNFFTFNIGRSKIDYRQSGANGAAMRALPIGLVNIDDLEKGLKDAASNSIITHGHPTAIIGAMLYVLSIHVNAKFTVSNFNSKEYLTVLGNMYKKSISHDMMKINEMNHWILKWNKDWHIEFGELFDRCFDLCLDQIRYVYKTVDSEISDHEVLDSLGCFDNKTKGSGIGTVLAGIFLFCRYNKEPYNGLDIAVNSFGADTDSIAGFYGGLVGFLHGDSIIKPKFKSLQDYSYIEKTGQDLFQIANENYTVNLNRTSNGDFNNIKDDNYKVGQNISFNPLGNGLIESIDRQDTITSGKYNLILKVQFDIGQSCIFSKLLDKV